MSVQHGDEEEPLALQTVISEFVSQLNLNQPDATPALPWAPDPAERPDVADSEPLTTLAIPATVIAAPGRELVVSLMSPPPEYDRSGRAPLVPPGPSAPPFPSESAQPRFSFLPDEPMKRPPPDPAARVFIPSERSEADLLARENAIRHKGPSALERAVDDVKEGTMLGASIIARAASTSAGRLRAQAPALTHAIARRISAMIAFGVVGVWRFLLLIASALARGLAAGGRATWHVTTRIVTGAVLALLALGLGCAAVLVGVVGAARTGVALLGRAVTARGQYLLGASRVASRATSRTVVRAGSAATTAAARTGTETTAVAAGALASASAFLSRATRDLSRLRLTIKWHAHTARPILSALTGAFATQIAQSTRQIQRRHAIAGLAAATAVLIAGVFGVSRIDRRAESGPAVSASTSSQSALASVAPATGPDAAALLDTLKGKSAAPLAPSAKPRRTSPSPKAVAPAVQEQAGHGGGSMLGTLLIASAPKGAKVTIDGVPRGVAPISVSRLRAGNRIVRLELAGYQRWSWAVYVSPSRETRLNVSLVPDTSSSPSSSEAKTAAAAK